MTAARSRGVSSGDVFVAMRGSWNRRPPSGYEVLRVDFENGKPVGFEKFLEGFLIEKKEGGYGYLARLAGLAVGKDGELFVSDNSNGIVYRISHEQASDQTASIIPSRRRLSASRRPPTSR